MHEGITDVITDQQTLEAMVNADKQAGNQTPEDIKAQDELAAETNVRLEVARNRTPERVGQIAAQLAREEKMLNEGNNWQETKQ